MRRGRLSPGDDDEGHRAPCGTDLSRLWEWAGIAMRVGPARTTRRAVRLELHGTDLGLLVACSVASARRPVRGLWQRRSTTREPPSLALAHAIFRDAGRGARGQSACSAGPATRRKDHAGIHSDPEDRLIGALPQKTGRPAHDGRSVADLPHSPSSSSPQPTLDGSSPRADVAEMMVRRREDAEDLAVRCVFSCAGRLVRWSSSRGTYPPTDLVTSQDQGRQGVRREGHHQDHREDVLRVGAVVRGGDRRSRPQRSG